MVVSPRAAQFFLFSCLPPCTNSSINTNKMDSKYLPPLTHKMYGMNRPSASLPPGFRFHPTDEELIIHYLKQKASPSSNPPILIIADVNIYKFNPWELPGTPFWSSDLISYFTVIKYLFIQAIYFVSCFFWLFLIDKAFFGENEWFFFSPRDKKYPNGTRPNRAAASGYWKATGTDKPIISSVGSQCLGMKKALVFYKGHPPKGVKTDWMMTEYMLLDDYFSSQRPKGSMRVSYFLSLSERRICKEDLWLAMKSKSVS